MSESCFHVVKAENYEIKKKNKLSRNIVFTLSKHWEQKTGNENEKQR